MSKNDNDKQVLNKIFNNAKIVNRIFLEEKRESLLETINKTLDLLIRFEKVLNGGTDSFSPEEKSQLMHILKLEEGEFKDLTTKFSE